MSARILVRRVPVSPHKETLLEMEWGRLSCGPVRDADGLRVGVVVFGHDPRGDRVEVDIRGDREEIKDLALKLLTYV